jgi:hypothetical protein
VLTFKKNSQLDARAQAVHCVMMLVWILCGMDLSQHCHPLPRRKSTRIRNREVNRVRRAPVSVEFLGESTNRLDPLGARVINKMMNNTRPSLHLHVTPAQREQEAVTRDGGSPREGDSDTGFHSRSPSNRNPLLNEYHNTRIA